MFRRTSIGLSLKDWQQAKFQLPSHLVFDIDHNCYCLADNELVFAMFCAQICFYPNCKMHGFNFCIRDILI